MKCITKDQLEKNEAAASNFKRIPRKRKQLLISKLARPEKFQMKSTLVYLRIVYLPLVFSKSAMSLTLDRISKLKTQTVSTSS